MLKAKVFFLMSVAFLLFSCEKKYKEELNIKASVFTHKNEFEIAKAIERDNIKLVNKLCAANPDIIYETFSERKYSLLHWACEIGRTEAVKALLKNGMNPDAVTENNETPLYRVIGSYAVFPSKDNSQIIKLLIQNGADCNFKKDRGIDVNGIDDEGETPFMKALYFGYRDIAKLMLETGNADVNAKTSTGVTAAVHELWYQDLEDAHFIICELKADVREPFYFNQNELDRPVYPVSLLQKIEVNKDSPSYILKQEIVQEFINQGISLEKE